MDIYRLPAFKDNYIFLLHDRQHQIAAVVDPGDGAPVLQCLEDLGSSLVAIFNTHHHTDHVGGNRQLLKHFPEAVVYGGSQDRGRIPEQQVFLQEGDRVSLGERSGQVLFVPGHTRGHIAYYFPPADLEAPEPWGELFCGDTLFAGGCGRLFEGTPSQMVNSLNKLRQLPDHTWVWCAHEYTLKNLEFALSVDTANAALQQRLVTVQALRAQHQPTIPTPLGLEKLTNPFLRWDQPALQAAVHGQTSEQTFAHLRQQKDRF
ncbi:MAG: hydroxyacylglutathione hydrolase [Cyanobacteria bacterium REEB459]|nr:hydroxyacylglutathione hydrolase [Cyanobacteria bacterium REEB459]